MSFSPGVNQLLGVNQCLRRTPIVHVFCLILVLSFFSFFFSVSFRKIQKTYFSQKQMISTSKRHADHPFAGRNTQHMKESKKYLTRSCTGKFNFKLIWPELDGVNKWTQTSNPTNETTVLGFRGKYTTSTLNKE